MDEKRAEDSSPPPWEDNFIKRMIELRTAKMSQTELARQLNDRGLSFHQQTVQRIEKGERPLRLNEAHAIAEILGSDPVDMARTVTSDEQELQHTIGELQFNSWHIVDSGLRWKRTWDRERHRLRVAAANLGEKASIDDNVVQTVQQAQRLIDQADTVNGLLTECYQKLTEMSTGQNLIESKVFDPVTRQDYIVTDVPWSPPGPSEIFSNWKRSKDDADADVEDNIDFT
jgi:transcriptional regulator with XRE-family HTH domain